MSWMRLAAVKKNKGNLVLSRNSSRDDRAELVTLSHFFIFYFYFYFALPMAAARAPGETLHKVVFIGESGTGKTCIIRQYVHAIFQAADKATIGVDFALKVIPPATPGGRSTTLQIWDVAGQERYGQMTQVYYRGAVGAVCVVDAPRPETFEAAVHWKSDLDSRVFLPGTTTNIPCILMINKIDLAQCHMSKEEVAAYCQRFNFVASFETSAKTNVGISEGIDTLLKHMERNSPNKSDDSKPKPEGGADKRVDISKPKPPGGGCPC